MVGYATSETPELLPLEYVLAEILIKNTLQTVAVRWKNADNHTKRGNHLYSE